MTDDLYNRLELALEVIPAEPGRYRTISASWDHPTKGLVSITLTHGLTGDDEDDDQASTTYAAPALAEDIEPGA
jgi:hypothetical protein